MRARAGVADLAPARSPRHSQDKLPDYLGFFQFVHNARQRDKALLAALVSALVANPDQHPGSR